MYVLIQGNPVDGLAFTGPFQDHESAVKAGEDLRDGGDWWVTLLNKPEGE